MASPGRRIGRPPTCECGECRKCKHRLYMRKWYRRMSPEQRREWMARKDKDLERQRDRERYQRHKKKRLAKIAARDPKKRRAMWMVNNRKRSGTIVPPDACERCGSAGPLQAHHPDYSKPLDVVWLCTTCHGREHRKPDHEFVGWGGEA